MNAGKVVVAVGCVYELAALPERSPLPTLTEMTTKPRRHPVPWILSVGWWIAAVHHFRPRKLPL